MSHQRYISNELTHFVGRNLPNDEERYQLFKQILSSEILMHPPFDSKIVQSALYFDRGTPFTSNSMCFTNCVCFCDIPVEDLHIHMIKYGKFGIAFSKNFLLKKGANPLFYVAVDPTIHYEKEIDHPYDYTPYADYAFYEHADPLLWEHRIRKLIDSMGQVSETGVPDFVFYRILSFIKAFDINRDESDYENYYMEREWRCIGNVKFSLDDVRRVIFPEKFAKRFRSDFPEYYQQITYAEE